MSAVIHIFKARARRKGYRMFISVYILWSCYSKCSVALRHGAVGWSAGISKSYSFSSRLS